MKFLFLVSSILLSFNFCLAKDVVPLTQLTGATKYDQAPKAAKKTKYHKFDNNVKFVGKSSSEKPSPDLMYKKDFKTRLDNTVNSRNIYEGTKGRVKF